MTVWVSGSAGKLGSEVVRQLERDGITVVGADVAGPGDHQVDLTDPDAVRRSLTGCDAVIHCAAIPSPENVEPADLVHNNTLSTFNVLQEAWRAGISTAVLASSGSIYGTAWSPEPTVAPYVPVTEDSPLDYVDPYALTKDFAERIGRMYARRGMTVTALRFHWILTVQELHELDGQTDERTDARNLWGYVELTDAARACLLALHPDTSDGRYHVLSITAADTRSRRPIEELLAEYAPGTEVRRPLLGSQGAWDCSRAQSIIGWEPLTGWR
ncbi:NAD-dependent epimerase/dehydratase family protein [Microlunatus soli]|uniref:NAD dependent epimerase/dehydratase family protein n=1 Tax=Microlunatus soli TaxID=630515 RepID=A0A1H1WVU0_9ACTN|nr:NAD(P)-dependent oxidoreductase [Microlunatus soli]SDT00496.1 NAD dependent epimerase/dehydratase family protein [Microlunatus soli]